MTRTVVRLLNQGLPSYTLSSAQTGRWLMSFLSYDPLYWLVTQNTSSTSNVSECMNRCVSFDHHFATFFIFFSNVIKRFFERYEEKKREGGGMVVVIFEGGWSLCLY